MKKKVIFAIFALACTLGVEAKIGTQIGNVMARKTTSLNGQWNYIVDVQEEGYYDYRMHVTRWGFFQNAKPRRPEDLIEYDFDKAPTMQVPGDWNTQDERLFFYEGTVWFKRSFDWHQTAGRRTLLYFGAVNYEAHVYVNGQETGHHVGGFTPFNMDVTELLKEGENIVIVKVDNKRRAENVPTLIFDWWNYGGITRDVCLVDVAETYVESWSLPLTPSKGRGNVITFSVKLNKPVEGQEVTLSIPELKVKKKFVTDAAGQILHSQFSILNSKLTLWSPETPKRYRVEVSMNGETLVDSIGFRTIEARGKQLLLNGKPIFLKGISIHEEEPNGGGRANGTNDAHTLLSWAKELGCNFVRLAHYPHNEYMGSRGGAYGHPGMERDTVLLDHRLEEQTDLRQRPAAGDGHDTARQEPCQRHHLEHCQRDAPLARARPVPGQSGAIRPQPGQYATHLDGHGGDISVKLQESAARQHEQICRRGILQPVYRLVS